MFEWFGGKRIRELNNAYNDLKDSYNDLKKYKLDEQEPTIEVLRIVSDEAINLGVYNKKLINSAKVIFTAMRNDAERGNLTASKVRAYRKKFFECEKDEQS